MIKPKKGKKIEHHNSTTMSDGNFVGLQECEDRSRWEDDALFLFLLVSVHRILKLETVGTAFVAESPVPSQHKHAGGLEWEGRGWRWKEEQ